MTQHHSNQTKEYASKITVLVCVTTVESYGSSSENFLLDPSLESPSLSEFSRFSRKKH